MIREHTFNSHWWGKPIGYVSDPAFFYLSDEERRDALAPYAWAEAAMPLADSVSHAFPMAKAGFVQVDTQVNFRINLRRVRDSLSLANLEVQFADEQPFSITSDVLAPFASERFLRIPDADQARVNDRIALWAAELLEKSPEHCLRISYGNQTQGWFLSQAGEQKSINLTLAIVARDASISGMYIYQKALRAYTARNHVLGWASFSITNTAVHNIYAHLGAHFLAPRGNWLWLPSAHEP
jgi:hypothetical protein